MALTLSRNTHQPPAAYVYDLTDSDDVGHVEVAPSDERNYTVRDAQQQTSVVTPFSQQTLIYDVDASSQTTISCQTDATQPYTTYDSEVKEVDTTSIALQTNESTLQGVNAHAAISNQPLSAQCVQFINNVMSTVESELQYNKDSTVFDTYDLSLLNTDDTDVVSKLCTLRPNSSTDTSMSGNDDSHRATATAVSSVCYNTLATSLCVAYGHTVNEHTGWCAHKSSIHIWSMLRNDIYADKPADTLTPPVQPDVIIPVDACCVTAVMYHPTRHSILCVGLYNGDIQLYDIDNKVDPLLCTSQGSEYTHREPVIRISMQTTATNRVLYMMTTSNDGSVLFWPLDSILTDVSKAPQQFSCSPIEGQQLRPCAKYTNIAGGVNSKYNAIGCMAMALSAHTQSTYITGTTAGAVLQCHVHNNRRVDYKKTGYTKPKMSEYTWSNTALHLWLTAVNPETLKQKIETHAQQYKLSKIELSTLLDAGCTTAELYKTPIENPYQSHSATVTGAAFSPFSAQLFGTVSTDSTLHIYHVKQSKALLIVDVSDKQSGQPVELISLAWSPVRPLVLAVCDSQYVYVYDLMQSSTEPVLHIQHRNSDSAYENNHQSTITSLIFNHKTGRQLIIADDIGCVTVYELGEKLSTLQQNETQLCKRLADSVTSTEE